MTYPWRGVCEWSVDDFGGRRSRTVVRVFNNNMATRNPICLFRASNPHALPECCVPEHPYHILMARRQLIDMLIGGACRELEQLG
jgi:hypothetical protein